MPRISGLRLRLVAESKIERLINVKSGFIAEDEETIHELAEAQETVSRNPDARISLSDVFG